MRLVLYNSKELDTDFGLNWYNYGARMYNPAVGRWNTTDPLAAKYASISPFAYVANNPLIYIDPDGRRIKGVKVKDGQITYSKRAIKNGTKRYIEARMKTKSGTSSIMSMIDAKKRYSVMATDKVFVLPTGNGKYALAAGVTDSESGVLVVTTSTARPSNVTDKQLNDAVTLGATGELTGVNIGQSDLENPISDPNGEYQQGYSAAYNDSGMAEFESDPNNTYQSAEEQIHGVGAHEEVHLTDPANIKANKDKNLYNRAYNTEKPAFDAEIKARKEYKKEN